VRSNIYEVRELLKNKKRDNLILVAQTAPAVHVAFSEGFDLEPGALSDNQIVGAIKQLGFDYVFDTNFAADFTVMEESMELLKHIQNGGPFPMFTSCCPAWVNTVEKNYPELIPLLSTCKSPMSMMGSLIKNYWARKVGADPSRIRVIAFMPCTAKKDEARRPQTNNDVDYVLTTQELIAICKLNGISKPQKIKEADYDNPLGMSSGAGMLFGASGGVMEASLRTAYEMLTNKPFPTLNFEPVRGLSGIKEATVEIAGKQLKVCVVNSLGNVHSLIRDIKTGAKSYHFVEVMACPGGCVGGGGEPKHEAKVHIEQLQKRVKAVYEREKTRPFIKAHENPAVKKVYEDEFKMPLSDKAKSLLHTYYTPRRRIGRVSGDRVGL
jgi:NADP-reducing hydrogenase subunit HndD